MALMKGREGCYGWGASRVWLPYESVSWNIEHSLLAFQSDLLSFVLPFRLSCRISEVG